MRVQSTEIVAARRAPLLPVGKPGRPSRYDKVQASELNGHVVRALFNDGKVGLGELSPVYWGCVSQVSDSAFTATQAVRVALSGIEPKIDPEGDKSPAGITVEEACVSGIAAVNLANKENQTSDFPYSMGGGGEHMDHSPMGSNVVKPNAGKPRQAFRNFLSNARHGLSIVKQTLHRAYGFVHMGKAAERILDREAEELAQKLAEHSSGISFNDLREEARKALAYELADYSFGRNSQGAFSARYCQPDLTIVPIPIKRRGHTAYITLDSGPRADTSIKKIMGLSPSFGGLHNPGTTCKDGTSAAGVLFAKKDVARERSLKSLGRIVATSNVTTSPRFQLNGVAKAINVALESAGLKVRDIDVFKIHEPFAIVPIVTMKRCDIDPAKVNTRGGAIAFAHPLGASGAIYSVQMLDELNWRAKHDLPGDLGVVASCAAGGQAAAVVFERG